MSAQGLKILSRFSQPKASGEYEQRHFLGYSLCHELKQKTFQLLTFIANNEITSSYNKKLSRPAPNPPSSIKLFSNHPGKYHFI